MSLGQRVRELVLCLGLVGLAYSFFHAGNHYINHNKRYETDNAVVYSKIDLGVFAHTTITDSSDGTRCIKRIEWGSERQYCDSDGDGLFDNAWLPKNDYIWPVAYNSMFSRSYLEDTDIEKVEKIDKEFSAQLDRFHDLLVYR